MSSHHFQKRTRSNQGNDPQTPIPRSWGRAAEFALVISNILFQGFMLGISEHVRPNVLLHHMVSGGLGNGPFTDFALLSVALRLYRRPRTFQVRGLYNPHTTQEGGCCHIKTWEQTQSTAWQIVPLASFSSPILTKFFVSLKNERKMVPKQPSLFARWKFHRIQTPTTKENRKHKKTKEPQIPSTLWSHFKLNILTL